MIRHLLCVSLFALYRPIAKLGLLRRVDASYRSFQEFRELPAERLEDMGLSEGDQRSAHFADFFNSPAHDRVQWP